jgi:DNA polymerase elongation subunit (family B)
MVAPEFVIRGIETRRHDTTGFIKEFQTELLYTLFDCNESADIFNETLENPLFCVTKTVSGLIC